MKNTFKGVLSLPAGCLRPGITAAEVRELGGKLPDTIPDCAVMRDGAFEWVRAEFTVNGYPDHSKNLSTFMSANPEAKKVEEPTPAAVMLSAARAESSKTLKEPKNQAYMTAAVLVQRLKEVGMTWDETVGLAVVLRQMTEAEANKLMYQALMGDVGEQGAKPQ